MTTQSMRGTRGGNRNDDLHTSCRAWVYSEDNADDVEARGDKKGGNDGRGGDRPRGKVDRFARSNFFVQRNKKKVEM